MYIMKDGNIEITKQHWRKDAFAIGIAKASFLQCCFDAFAIGIAMNGAFWIGLLLGEGTLGLALVIGLISYIVIRYFQTKGLI